MMLDMCRRFACAALLLAVPGCAMCVSSADLLYPADGGRWQRLDPVFGRVGSAFTPEVGMRVEDGEAGKSSEMIQPGQPTPAIDTLESPPDATVLDAQEVVVP